MQQKASPAMVVVAIVVLAIIIVGIWYITMGKKTTKPRQTIDAGTMQPKTPEEAAAAGYKQAPGPGQMQKGGPPVMPKMGPK